MRNLQDLLAKVPLVGGMANQALDQVRDGLKASLTGGMLFEETGLLLHRPRRWTRSALALPLAPRCQEAGMSGPAPRADGERARRAPGQ